jgi:predicted nucleotidyltransferase
MLNLDAKRQSLLALCRRHRVKRLVLFGSALTGDFDPETSDVDLLVEFEDFDQAAEYANNYFEFLAALELLMDRRVDLMTVNSLHNPYLKASIEASQELLYAA